MAIMVMGGAAAGGDESPGEVSGVDWIGFILLATLHDRAGVRPCTRCPDARAAPTPCDRLRGAGGGGRSSLWSSWRRVSRSRWWTGKPSAQREFVMGLAIGSLGDVQHHEPAASTSTSTRRARKGSASPRSRRAPLLLPLSVFSAGACVARALRRCGPGRIGRRHDRRDGPHRDRLRDHCRRGRFREAAARSGLGIGLVCDGRGSGRALRLGAALGALGAVARRRGDRGRVFVNACTFLGGSFGVAGGAMGFASGQFVAVLAMIALAGVIGAALGRLIPNTI